MALKIKRFLALGILSSFHGIGAQDLTDAERQLSQDYTHEGKQRRIITESCLEKANPGLGSDGAKRLSTLVDSEDLSTHQKKMISRANDLCQGRMEAKAFGLGEGTVKMASKMWSLVMGLGGGGGMTMKNLNDVAEEEPEEQSDVCRYIPVGTEAVAAFQQRTTNNHIINSVHPKNDAQYAAIMKAARMYDSQKDNTKVLTVGWGLTSACYTALMAKGGVELNPVKGWQNYLKMGASTFMTLYYMKMIKIHGNRASIMRGIAESLPKRGDCNPVTDRNCYCTEETSRNDPKYEEYCAPFAQERKTAPLQKKVSRLQGCIDNRAKEDPSCRCMIQKNCLDNGFERVFQKGSLPGLSGTAFITDLKGLARGGVDTGEVTGLARAKKYAAKSIDFLKKNIKEIPDDAPLSPEEKRQVRILKNTGLPGLISRGLALHTPTANERWMAQGFNRANEGQRKSSSRSREKKGGTGKVLTYEGGEGLGPKRKRKRKGDDFSNPYAHLLGKKKGGKNSPQGKTLAFAQRAHEAAQVHRLPETSLFAIISARYRVRFSE